MGHRCACRRTKTMPSCTRLLPDEAARFGSQATSPVNTALARHLRERAGPTVNTGERHVLVDPSAAPSAVNPHLGKPMDATGAESDLHDGDLQPAIRLGAAHQTHGGRLRRESFAVAGDLFPSDRIPDFSLSFPGLSD